MNTGFMIITNNPLVKEKLGEDYHVEYEELSYEDTLKKVTEDDLSGIPPFDTSAVRKRKTE